MAADWTNAGYLASGTERQRKAHRALQDAGIFAVLHAYSPVLAGTIPLDIDIASSDLDILCEANELEAFHKDVVAAFGTRPGFSVDRALVDDLPTRLARFSTHGESFEIFAQPRQVTAQTAYRHLVVEARLLVLGGASARSAIRQLKQDGAKTEPAFAEYFGIDGDPYRALLRLADLDDDALRSAVRRGLAC